MSQHVLSLSANQSNWIPYIDLICTGLAALLWLAWPQWGVWLLILALVPWLLRWRQTGQLSATTSLTAPLGLFMITAVMGLWAAYNPTAAWAKFWVLVAAIFLFFTIANQPAINLWFIAKLLSLFTVLVAVYFLLTHDWQAEPTYMSLLDGLAERWMGIRPFLKTPPLHPNQAAGFIVVFAPLVIAVGWRGWRTRSILGWGITAIVATLILFALLLTGSRGAWLALIVALTVWGWSALG